jgi:hypothetical protein
MYWPRILLVITVGCSGCSKSPDEPTVVAPRDSMENIDSTSAYQASSSSTPTPGIANSSSEPVKERVAIRFEKWFGPMQDQNVMPIGKARLAWRESWLEIYNLPLPSSSHAPVQQGDQNPDELLEVKQPVKPYILQIAEGKLDLASDEQELESMMCLHMLLAGVMLQGGYHLPELLDDRINQLPPNRGDLITFQLAQDALQLHESGDSPITPAQSALWERMSQAGNPVYRQLAIKAYPRLAATNEDVVRFLQGCDTETDEQNLLLLVSSAAALPEGMGLQYLKNLQARGVAQTSSNVASAIKASIEDIERRR